MEILTILLQDAQAPKGGMGSSLLLMIALIAVFVVFFILPQNKKAKEQRKFREELKKGDKVVTIGGFHGKITEVKETTVMLSIAPNMEVEIEKTALVKDSASVGQA